MLFYSFAFLIFPLLNQRIYRVFLAHFHNKGHFFFFFVCFESPSPFSFRLFFCLLFTTYLLIIQLLNTYSVMYRIFPKHFLIFFCKVLKNNKCKKGEEVWKGTKNRQNSHTIFWLWKYFSSISLFNRAYNILVILCVFESTIS